MLISQHSMHMQEEDVSSEMSEDDELDDLVSSDEEVAEEEPIKTAPVKSVPETKTETKRASLEALTSRTLLSFHFDVLNLKWLVLEKTSSALPPLNPLKPAVSRQLEVSNALPAQGENVDDILAELNAIG